MDPIYGFAAVNVEAQSRDPHSLLNWMRRMTNLRRRHQAFGRGTIRFLYPDNRRVLVYLREYEGETLMCVANLSRLPQPVELDLSQYAGATPIEITGPSPFPPIGQLPYLLTLPPFGFYWFELQRDVTGASWRQPQPDMMPDFRTFVVRDSLAELMDDRHTITMLREILPEYLLRRRWFAGKGKPLKDVRLAYTARLSDATNVAISELAVTSGDRTDRYCLPATIVWEGEIASPLIQQLAFARVRQKRNVGVITDAFTTVAFTHAVVRAMLKRETVETADGTLHFRGSDLLDGLEGVETADIRWLSAEQSNSSLLIGDLAMLKLIRRIVPGIHPEAEMTRYLTKAGYKNAPLLLGDLTRVAKDGTPHTIAVLESHITNHGDGWTFLVDTLKRHIEDVAMRDGNEAEHAPFGDLTDLAGLVGRRLGEMHVVLAQDTDEADFTPVIADRQSVEDLTESAIRQFEAALASLDQARGNLDDDTAKMAGEVLDMAGRLRKVMPKLARSAEGTLFTRIHGDFHLGQVLIAPTDAYIIDFEGEPMKTLDERRAKSTPLADVAGFLRSLDYAAASVARPDNDASLLPVREKRGVLIESFRKGAAEAFLSAYWEAVAADERLKLSPESRPLLELMLIAKASYEVTYEVANRPGWLGLPLDGLLRIGKGITARG